MAAPQRKPVTRPPVKRPVQGREPKERKSSSWSWRRFVVVVLVPVALMLGSVYAHTMAGSTDAEAARLGEEKATAEAEGERLEVRVAELSESGSIREAAKDDLGMREPSGKDLSTYGSKGEDVVDGGEESKKGAGE